MKFKTEAGRALSEFRRSILVSTLIDFQKDSLGLFSSTSDEDIAMVSVVLATSLESSGSVKGRLRIPRPHWLKTGAIDDKDFEYVRQMKKSTESVPR